MESKVSLNFRYKYDLEDLNYPSTGGNIVKSKIDEDDKGYNFLLEVDNKKVASILGLDYDTDDGKSKVRDIVGAVTSSIWRQASWTTTNI